MKTTPLGSARTLLLAALALAAVAMVVAIALIAARSGSSGDAGDDLDPRTRPRARGDGDPASRRSSDTEEDDPEEEDDGIYKIPGEIQIGADGRPVSGDEYWVTPDTLRAVFADRHWEEVRRMIESLQADGKPLPADVLKQLIDMLSKDELRLDAVLALGGVKEDETGRKLAELALSSEASTETRQAALDALAKSGQKSALPLLQQLVATDGVDDAISRRAYFAIAGVGGPDATRTLRDLLAKHHDDDKRDAILGAVGKVKGGDAEMAEMVRSARDKGEKLLLQSTLIAAQIQGAGVGPELKAELLRTVEGEQSLTAFPEELDRQIVQGSAMPAAVAAGIIEPILRHATASGPLRDIALNALRSARGDEAAKQIAAALNRSTDDTQRRELTVALGETGSRAATSTLVTLLDDPSDNTRHAAARALSTIRDPAAVKSLLSHLAAAPPDSDFARSIVLALGTIGHNEALAPLQKLAGSEEAFWRDLRPFVRNAIVRIQTGNPESLRLDSKEK